MSQPRLTTPRRRHRILCKRTRPPCAICGRPIDYELPATDDEGFVSDHIIPVGLGGSDTDMANRQPAHNLCNRLKAEGILDLQIKRSGSLK
jgi:hypothetical protein